MINPQYPYEYSVTIETYSNNILVESGVIYKYDIKANIINNVNITTDCNIVGEG